MPEAKPLAIVLGGTNPHIPLIEEPQGSWLSRHPCRLSRGAAGEVGGRRARAGQHLGHGGRALIGVGKESIIGDRRLRRPGERHRRIRRRTLRLPALTTMPPLSGLPTS